MSVNKKSARKCYKLSMYRQNDENEFLNNSLHYKKCPIQGLHNSLTNYLLKIQKIKQDLCEARKNHMKNIQNLKFFNPENKILLNRTQEIRPKSQEINFLKLSKRRNISPIINVPTKTQCENNIKNVQTAKNSGSLKIKFVYNRASSIIKRNIHKMQNYETQSFLRKNQEKRVRLQNLIIGFKPKFSYNLT